VADFAAYAAAARTLGATSSAADPDTGDGTA
jgi:hypothetical protein